MKPELLKAIQKWWDATEEMHKQLLGTSYGKTSLVWTVGDIAPELYQLELMNVKLCPTCKTIREDANFAPDSDSCWYCEDQSRKGEPEWEKEKAYKD